jgi:serine/threonine protein kinase
MLRTGTSLFSATSNIDLTPGPYRLLLTTTDALLQWSTNNSSFLSYWALSLDLRATTNSNKQIVHLSVNATGLYLISSNDTNSVVSDFHFPPPTSNKEVRFLRLEASGQLHIMSYYLPNNSKTPTSDLSTLLSAPVSQCDLPFTCKALGLCSSESSGLKCSCPSDFGASTGGGCVPAEGLVLPSCSSGMYQQSSVSYVSLGIGIDYFANKFASPDPSINDILSCENMCSGNCSCLGFFYKNSSKACYLLENKLGTLLTSNTEDYSSAVGYVKTMRLSPSQREKNHSTFFTMFLIVLLPCIASIVGMILCYKKLKKWRKGIPIGRARSEKDADATGLEEDHNPSTLLKEEEVSIPGLPTRFTYSDLEIATAHFSKHIGSGGFGSVYKGILSDKTTVAVKRMANMGKQARHEFLTEIAIISNIRHINLVKLRGFCAEGNHRMLVYEYMNRGSLDQPLFKLSPPLDWSERLQIAVGAAHGLAYLHSGCEHKIIHCDVKPENILLDDQKGIKIADFGLAKLIAPDQSSLFTTLRGTRGYLAPEWLTNSSITDRTDVYSFGMVLLEIVHGRKNWSEGSWSKPASGTKTTNHYFPMMALKKHEEGSYGELIDPRIEQKVDKEEIEKVIKVALCCLHEEPCFRPSMGAVVAMLEGSMQVWEPRLESLRHHLIRYERGFMAMDTWGINQPLDEGMDTEPAKRACFESNSTINACNLPSYFSAEPLSGPR